jgi:hypothetical protein
VAKGIKNPNYKTGRYTLHERDYVPSLEELKEEG